MSQLLEFGFRAVLIGTGATLTMDLWTILLKHGLGVRFLDYGMVGRWMGHLPNGRFVHSDIAKAPPVRGERVVGWVTHYVTGIAFAAILLALFGLGWARNPTFMPALTVGLLTVAAPFLIMQPALRAGLAARKTPNPNLARLRSIATHGVFGIGLYGSGEALELLAPLPA